MYRSWKNLKIKDQRELQSPERLKKVARATSVGLWVAAIGFYGAAVICLALTILMLHVFGVEKFYAPGLFAALLILLMAAVFLWCGGMFKKAISHNLILSYLKNPNDFEFIKGTFSSAQFIPGDTRRQGKMLVDGEILSSSGDKIRVIESFNYAIWPFAAPDENNEQKRAPLPISAYFICAKKDPTHAQFVGIDADLVDRALALLR